MPREDEVDPKPQPPAPANALEAFGKDLDEVSAVLKLFAEGDKDPHNDIDLLKETYEDLYPLYDFLSDHLRKHRHKIPDELRQTIGKINTSASSLNIALIAEDTDHPHLLDDFISHTLDNIEDIKPVLRELDPPKNPS